MACVPSAWSRGGPVLASWRLNLLRGSAAQWWEVGRTHNNAPTICPGLPSDQDAPLGRPSQGLTALHKPIHKAQWRRWRGGRLDVRERSDMIGCGGAVSFREGGVMAHSTAAKNSSRAKTRHTANCKEKKTEAKRKAKEKFTVEAHKGKKVDKEVIGLNKVLFLFFFWLSALLFKQSFLLFRTNSLV